MRKIEVYLAEDELAALEQYAAARTIEQRNEDEKNNIPPSRRCRKFTRSRAARELIANQLEWHGFIK